MSAALRYLSSPVSRLVTVLDRDRLLAAALFAVFEIPVLSQGLAAGHDPQGASWKWTAVGAVTGAVMTLAVAGRRQRPRRTWLIACACALFLLATPTQLGLPFTAGPAQTALLVLPAPVVALYTVARTGRVRGGYALAGSALALILLPLILLNVQWLLDGPSSDVQRANGRPYAAIAAGVLIVTWALAERMNARSRIDAVERAEHDRVVAAEERARIAAELHDITAHHISVVSLQAGAARLLAEQGQPPSVELLAGIEATSRQAMAEIRQALGVIRASPDGAAPLPGLAQLPDLATRMALAGRRSTIDGPAASRHHGPDCLPDRPGRTRQRRPPLGGRQRSRNVPPGAGLTARHGRRRRADPRQPASRTGRSRTDRAAGTGAPTRRTAGCRPRPSGGFELRADIPLGDST